MAFRFSLAAVLTYREALEKRELAALEKTQQEIALLTTQIRNAEQDLCLLERSREEGLKRGMPSIHLQDALEQERAVERLQKDLTKEREDLKVEGQEIFKSYQEQRRKRELLEKLLERRRSEYERKQSKGEQAAIDDLFLSRWSQLQ